MACSFRKHLRLLNYSELQRSCIDVLCALIRVTNTSSFENMPSNLSHDRTQAAEVFTCRDASSSQTKLIAGDLKGEDVFVGRLPCLLAVVLHDEKDRH